MENFKERISGYIEINKKNSKLNKTEVSDVGMLLKTGLAEGDIIIDDTIDILLDLHYVVTSEFIKNVFVDISDEGKADFISKFMSADKIVKNASNYGVTRCLIIINSLLQMGSNDKYIHIILKASAKRAYGKDGGQKAGELLTKICLDDTKLKLLLLDYSTWDETELRNLSVWLNNAISHTQNQEIIDGYLKFLEKYHIPMIKKAQTGRNSIQSVEGVQKDIFFKSAGETAVSSLVRSEQNAGDLGSKDNYLPKSNTENPIPKKESCERIISLVSQLQSEADRVVNEKLKLSDEISDMKSKFEQSIKEKEGLIAQLSEINSKNSRLQDQIRINEIKILDAEKKMAEMNERLEYAYKADKRASNQELVELKNGLVKQLRLEYEAYKKLALKEPAQYHLYYEGLVGIIENIFDSLRRKGIVIDNENEG